MDDKQRSPHHANAVAAEDDGDEYDEYDEPHGDESCCLHLPDEGAVDGGGDVGHSCQHTSYKVLQPQLDPLSSQIHEIPDP